MGATRESKERVGRAFTEYIDRGIVNLGIGEDGHPDDPSELRSRVHTWSHLWFKQDEHGDLDEAIAELPLSLFDFDYDAVLHHHNTIHPRKMARAHILRMAHGWEHATALRTYLKSQPHLLGPMGFDGLPDQSAFHRAWGRFSDRHQDALETATREIVGAARYRGVPAPAKAFQTEHEQENETGERSERQLTVKKTKEIWEQTQPHLCEEFSLNRAPNWSIPEVGYWSQHAFAGLKGKYIQSAANADDFRDGESPCPVEHRRQLQKLDVEAIRENLHEVNKRLIREARRKNELDRGVTVAIDRTKGPVDWHGEVERDDDNNILEDWILGYKSGDLYFQWATIQVVGDDIPIILDAIPVKRGMKREDIVDELLTQAKKLVNIEEVQADREYDVYGVRDVVEDHGLIYRTPGKVTGLRGDCTKLREKGAYAHIKEQKSLGESNNRKIVFVPANNDEVFKPKNQQEDEDDSDEPEDTEEVIEERTDQQRMREVREELVEDFEETVDADATEEDGEHRMFGDFMDEVKEEEEQREESEIYGSDADVDAYAIFKTNDPRASISDYDDLEEDELIEIAHRSVRPYRRRWAIEEGNKKLKEFMAKTKCDDHELRYFNMAFGSILYNVWRLVDLLVQLSLEREYDYEPHVTADEFLTCAEEHFDLDNPPPAPQVGAV